MSTMSQTGTSDKWEPWSDPRLGHSGTWSERAFSQQSRHAHDTAHGTADGAPALLPFHYEKCADWDAVPRVGGQPQHLLGCKQTGSWARYHMLSNRSLEDLEPSRSTSSAAVSASGDEHARDHVYDAPIDCSAGGNPPRKGAYASACSISSDPRDSHGTCFRLRSQNDQRNRALKRASQFWDKRAARLAPMPAKYSLHGRTSGWLAVMVSPPVEEKHLREALEQFMSHLLRVTKQTWPLAAWAPYKDKEGAHLGKQYFKLLPGGKRDLSTKIMMSMTMYSSTLQRFTLCARADLLDIVHKTLSPKDNKDGQE